MLAADMSQQKEMVSEDDCVEPTEADVTLLEAERLESELRLALHVRHEEGSKQAATQPATAGLATSPLHTVAPAAARRRGRGRHVRERVTGEIKATGVRMRVTRGECGSPLAEA